MLSIAQSGLLVTQTFDKSLMAINYARAAAANFTAMQATLARRWAASDPSDQQKLQQTLEALGQALDEDLTIAAERSQSERAACAVARVKDAVVEWIAARDFLLAGIDPHRAWEAVDRHAATVAQEIDLLINYTAGDGFTFRQSAREAVARAQTFGLLATIAAILLSALVSWALARQVIGPVATASAVAERIAAGDLSGEIPQGGTDELGTLLVSMGIMRDRIRAKVEEEVAQRRFAQARLGDALENMSQGLCLYDAEDRLHVVNRRFCEIFGLSPEQVRPGITLRDVVELSISAGNHDHRTGSDLSALQRDFVAGRSTDPHILELGNGRIVAIVSRPTADGGSVATYEDITERARAEAQILFMARHDSLTNLPNRVLFRERIEQALACVRRIGGTVAVLCLDLDHFKAVNDTLGHPIGDALLQKAADRLRATLRAEDTVARLGGDEFAIVMESIARPEDASALARRIVSTIAEPYSLDGHEVIAGTSIGVALAPKDGADADQLLKNADLALYRAKSEGRGTWRFFESDMQARVQARRSIELDLRKALADGEFQLHYQPLVALADRAVVGFEALIRWHHPQRGPMRPADFIPVAEEAGLISTIGEWVLRTACADAVHWPERLKVAVNLSPAQFRRRNVVRMVAEALDATGLAPDRLELEITESILLQENEATLSVLRHLRSLGVRISLDDFGTGYSSLGYLRGFPFDKIKIDQSFVRDLATNADCAAIIVAIAGLGASLGMVTTAEGVETEAQLLQVRAAGCTEAQGYYLGRPAPASDIEQILRLVPGRVGVAA